MGKSNPPRVDRNALAQLVRQVQLVDAAWLFGSEATGQTHSNSDIDVALRTRDDAPLPPQEVLTLMGEVGLAFGRDLHPVHWQTAPLALRMQVHKFGVPLFDDDVSRTLDERAADMIRYWDEEPLRRIQQQASHARLAALRAGDG